MCQLFQDDLVKMLYKVHAWTESDLVWIVKITFYQKWLRCSVLIIGHTIDYNGAGVLRGQQHIPNKISPSVID